MKHHTGNLHMYVTLHSLFSGRRLTEERQAAEAVTLVEGQQRYIMRILLRSLVIFWDILGQLKLMNWNYEL